MPERWLAVHKRCLLGATESHPGELFVRANGEEQWVRWEIQPWHQLDGSVGGLVLFSEDITAQKLSERVLQESERRLRLAQQIAQVGAFDWNVQTGERYWSPELLAMYGLSESTGAPSRQTWESMIHPEDRPEVLRQLEQSLESGRFEAEWRIILPDASDRWMTGRGSLIRGDAGQPLQLVGLLLDVTERKCAELEVRRLNADLERRVRERTAELVTASQEMEAFAYSVSHDLRAPLRGIDGWSLALAEDYGRQLDARAHQYIDRVRSETQRMGLLIDDMLELSRVGRSQMHVGDVGLSELVQLVAGRLREGNGSRDIEFSIEPGLTARGDVRLLEIALTNLLENAVKFTATRERALIEFGAKRDGDEAIYSVRDNGVGFDMRYSGSLFGPFQRLHKATEFPGTGIGLAIVQRVINRHGGRIWAEAEQDRGAAFFFTLGHP
jgi:hypothetical protein